jgi:hypothetical protein
MDYKQHTKDRFIERFVPMNKSKQRKFWRERNNKNWTELTDTDYLNLCELCNTNPLHKQLDKVIVRYNNTYIWCVLTRKKKVVKTIYPITKGHYNRFLKIYETTTT